MLINIFKTVLKDENEADKMLMVEDYAVYDAQRSPFCFRTAVFRSQRPPIFS